LISSTLASDPDAKFIFVGHSLGGALSDYALEQLAPVFGREILAAITIDAPALQPSTIGNGDLDVHAINIANAADLVTGLTLAARGKLPSVTLYYNTTVNPTDVAHILGQLAALQGYALVHPERAGDIGQAEAVFMGALLSPFLNAHDVDSLVFNMINLPELSDTTSLNISQLMADTDVSILRDLAIKIATTFGYGEQANSAYGSTYVDQATGQQLFPQTVSRYNSDTNVFELTKVYRPPTYVANGEVVRGFYGIGPNGGWRTDPRNQNPAAAKAFNQGQTTYLYDGFIPLPTVDIHGNQRNTDGDAQLAHDFMFGMGSTGFASARPRNPTPSIVFKKIGSPVLLDLDGDGISVDPLSSSNTYFDMAGDGLQHRTAWAAAGDGVLVRDAGNDGVIDHQNEVDFTQWDPTANTDMQALLDVFDTNHNGALDAGDADWSYSR